MDILPTENWYNLTSDNLWNYTNDVVLNQSLLSPTDGIKRSRTEGCKLQGLWLMRVIFHVGLSLPVEICGIIGNVIAFIVLLKQRPSTTTSFLLQCLSLADISVLLLSIILHSLRTLHVCFIPNGAYLKAMPFLYVYVFPFVYIARMCTTWFTVLMTVDRFIAVCRPLHAQRLCTLSRVYKEVVILLLITGLYSIPRFMEHKLANNSHGFKTTSLASNTEYTIGYRIILFFLVTYLIPIGVLSVLNIVLVRTLRRAEATRDQMRVQNKDVSLKRDITIVVAIVVLVFIVCNIPAMIAHLFWSLQITFNHLKYLETPRRYLSNFSNFMVTFNSAINFVIYCLFSRNFRNTLRRIFCRRYAYHQRRISEGSTKTGSVYLSLQSTNSAGKQRAGSFRTNLKS